MNRYNLVGSVPIYRIRSGHLDRLGRWRQGSYDEHFRAHDFEAAKNEADRALRCNEIRGVETGDYVLVDGLDGSARRSIDQHCGWDAAQA